MNTPLISDTLLRELSQPTDAQLRGEYDDETRALLAMAVPELCAELLRWRETARNRPAALALALRSQSIQEQIENARRTIRAEAPDRTALITACATLIRHSQDAIERDAAARVLGDLQVAA